MYLMLCITPPARALAENTASINPAAIKLEKVLTLSEIGASLNGKRVVYVGETHDAYQDHLVQLDLLNQLREANPDMAIGVEWFQTPFQSYLDDYIAGRIDEGTMLEKTEYFGRWSFDYRLYQPIMNYAREQKIPVVALNAPAELISAISKQGIDNLPEDLRSGLPASYDFDNKAYRERLERVWKLHTDKSRQFQFFYESQLTWDETMAQNVANYLEQHPAHNMIVFAGRGHISHRFGIPSRVQRRIRLPDATVLTSSHAPVEPGMADYLVFSGQVNLPEQGKLGAFLAADDKGVKITGFVPHSAAEQAGLRKDDVITAVDGHAIRTYAELKLRIMDSKPGDRVEISYLRKRWLLGIRERRVSFELGR
jgi:uncharacterized iron-regulated protein